MAKMRITVSWEVGLTPENYSEWGDPETITDNEMLEAEKEMWENQEIDLGELLSEVPYSELNPKFELVED
jgi:hypothetical protein